MGLSTVSEPTQTSRSTIARLKSELGYTQAGAQLVLHDLEESDPRIQSAFHEWLRSGALPAIVAEGYDVPRLMREHSMNIIAALLTLDWLLREPQRAISSLRKGHDRLTGRALKH